MKILHVLDHSLPEQSGYAFRSEAIIRAQREAGILTVQLTGPKQGAAVSDREVVGELEYLRSPGAGDSEGGGPLAQLRVILALRRRLKQTINSEHPDVLHVHSPWLNGLAALGLGCPVLYEMRSFWEDAAVSSGVTTVGSMRYRVSHAMETFVARRAGAIATISQGLKQDLIVRGIPADKIVISGNAINPDDRQSPSSDQVSEIRRRHGLDGRKVLGFFGSFFEWEGLTLLIEAMPEIVRRQPNAVLLLVGGGIEEPKLKAMVAASGLDDHVIFAGRVPHAEINAYYHAADLMVFPRVSSRLTELVTPLKPLESMALGRLVVASDVGGHKELIENGVTGLLFRAGDKGALSDAVCAALN
ncbi:MAG: glycosyltransferase, exosortase A system-associated, partial [Halioglobus sp.]|nr:glycosyltransferase, exosortase A system-associated [Halioglobus sp.]